jgi:hypothetical protein
MKERKRNPFDNVVGNIFYAFLKIGLLENPKK